MADNGRRIIMRNIRFLAPKTTSRTKRLGLHGLDRPDPQIARFLATVDRAMAHL